MTTKSLTGLGRTIRGEPGADHIREKSGEGECPHVRGEFLPTEVGRPVDVWGMGRIFFLTTYICT
jgi:hypothetical protein